MDGTVVRIAILVPRREDNGWRDRLWSHCKSIWQTEYPDWPIFEGHHEVAEGPFNRSLAINRASELADGWLGGWDVALVIDADTISRPEAIRKAVQYAWETGELSVAHNARLMLTRRGTEALLSGGEESLDLRRRQHVKITYYDSVSCAVAVRRAEWDLVGGFDTRFEGWGFEDTAFRVAVETLTNRPMHIEQADCLHLWHESSPEASRLAPTFSKNTVLKLRYEKAHYQPERLHAVLNELPDPGVSYSAIPKVIHRTLPEQINEEVEAWWANFQILHPEWELKTWRDPLDPKDFPLTSHLFDRCANGAQKAGLVRLELLVTHGGVYVDSDVEAVRPLDALMYLPAFAAWEDDKVVPDAVLGAAPGHPAFHAMLNKAISLIEGGSKDAWETGPGVTTAILPWRDDVLLLPPGSFYPVHYREKRLSGTRNKLPWVFLEHKWHHSWAAPKTKPVLRVTAQEVIPAEALIELPENLHVVLCMPWKDIGDKWRAQAHQWCSAYWQEHGLTVVEGTGSNRSQMCNNAAAAALELEADILVFVDADTWSPIAQVAAATIQAQMTGQLVHAFDKYIKLDANTSKMNTRLSSVAVKSASLARRGRAIKSHVSGLTAVPVTLWNRLGGFDERFNGWGFEDQAFQLAAETIGGETHRIEGTAFHWYHRDDPTKARTVNPDDPRLALMTEYCQAAATLPTYGRVGRLVTSGFITIDASQSNAEQMQIVLSGPGGPLSHPDVIL